MSVRAFRTECIGVASIVFAETSSKARYATYLSANDAGYRVGFPQIRVTRAPQYDPRRMTCGGVPGVNACHDPVRLVTA